MLSRLIQSVLAVIEGLVREGEDFLVNANPV